MRERKRRERERERERKRERKREMTPNARHTALVEGEDKCDCTAVAKSPPCPLVR
jgi:hypothetical protein